MATSKKTFALYDAGGDLTKRWFVYWFENGKRHRAYGQINRLHTVEARRAAALELLANMRTEQHPTPSAEPTLAEVLTAAMAERMATMRKKSHCTYSSRVKEFLTWCAANNVVRTDQVQPEIIAAFYEHLLRTGRKPGTIDGYQTTLSALLGPQRVRAVKAPAFTHEPARRFSRADRLRLAGHLAHTDPELWLFVQFVYYCFVRPRTELRLLTTDCLLLDEGQLVVPAALSKSKKTRYVPIPATFLAELRGCEFPGPYLFGGAKPYGHNTMAVRHTKYLKKLGLSPTEYKLYSWRHTAAAEAVKAGVPIKILQLWMGHSSPDITDKYLRQIGITDTADYTHLVGITQ